MTNVESDVPSRNEGCGDRHINSDGYEGRSNESSGDVDGSSEEVNGNEGNADEDSTYYEGWKRRSPMFSLEEENWLSSESEYEGSGDEGSRDPNGDGSEGEDTQLFFFFLSKKNVIEKPIVRFFLQLSN